MLLVSGRRAKAGSNAESGQARVVLWNARVYVTTHYVQRQEDAQPNASDK
jgi:hypothetical protein